MRDSAKFSVILVSSTKDVLKGPSEPNYLKDSKLFSKLIRHSVPDWFRNQLVELVSFCVHNCSSKMFSSALRTKLSTYQLKALALSPSLQVQAAHSAMSQVPVQDVVRAISLQLLYRLESSARWKSDSHLAEICTE